MSGINYKVRARGKWDWKQFDTVRMEISVGQPYHEGDKLREAMSWARENFGKRVLIVGDAPQRYNLMFTQGLSEKEAYNVAVESGTAWLARNKPFLHGMEITRWDEWKNHRSYQAVEKQVHDLYKTNAGFHAALQDAITGVWLRRYAAGTFDKSEFYALSEQYLLEETTVFAVAYDAIGGISAYPGDFLQVWEMFIDAAGHGIPPGLKKAHCARLSFEKKRAQASSYASNDYLNAPAQPLVAGISC